MCRCICEVFVSNQLFYINTSLTSHYLWSVSITTITTAYLSPFSNTMNPLVFIPIQPLHPRRRSASFTTSDNHQPQHSFLRIRRPIISSHSQQANGIPIQPRPQPSQTPPKPPPPPKHANVTRLLTLFRRLSLPYFKSSTRARYDIAAVTALTFLQSGVSVLFSFISRDFWTALNTKNLDLFYHQAELFFGALIIFTPIVVYYQYYRDATSLRWRDWLTRHVVNQYTDSRNFYRLEGNQQVDNPDQRISQDLAAFTTESLTLVTTLLVSSIDLVSFSAILFSIYPLLFVILLIYAATGTYFTARVGKDLLAKNYNQLVVEADLRYSLIRLRENAESIAFFNGEGRETSEILRRLGKAVDNMTEVIRLRRRLGFLQTGYRYAVQVLPALCVAPRYFAGAIELGSVTQSFSAFSHILGDLSLVVNRFDSLSQFGAGIDRLAEFTSALEANLDKRTFETGEVGKEEPGITVVEVPGRVRTLSIDGLSVCTPGGRELVEGLSVALSAGERLLVAGPSGTGKSSLLRAIAGLWGEGSGTITRPMDGVMFLPQKPYCTLGSLRDNLLYPRENVGDVEDKALMAVLRDVELKELPGRMGGLDAVADWSDVLSVGEQQRLQFARLLSSECTVAIIDEGSSALSVEAERRMYDLVGATGCTVISVGHRPSLLAYHDTILRLREGGDWDVDEIRQDQKEVVLQTL